MLEGVVTGLLNKFLGDFIEGLDAQQLKLGVWGGDINLTQLKIKPSALDFLHLPVGVRMGYLGRLHVSLNWRALLSQPVEVVVEDVMLIACSKDLQRIDEVAEAKRALEAKLASLKSVEAFKLSEVYQSALQGFTPVAAAKGGFISNMVHTIIDNIRISVKNVHIRFEHEGEAKVKGGVGGAPTALGVVLRSLRLTSTDELGHEKFVPAGLKSEDSSGRNLVFKKLMLEEFFVYFNTERTGREATKQIDTEEMKRMCTQGKEVVEQEVDYLIKPISGSVRVQMNKNEARDGEPPFLQVGVRMQPIEVTLDEVQYHALLKVLASISKATAADRIIHQRYVDLFRNGSEAEQQRYIALYKRTFSPSWEPELDASEQAELERLDKELTYSDLANYRAIAFSLLHAHLPTRTLSKRMASKDVGAVKRWVGYGVSAAKTAVGKPATDLLPGPDVKLDDRKMREIIQAVLEDPSKATDTSVPALDTDPEDKPDPKRAPRVSPGHVMIEVDLEQPHISLSLLNRSRRVLTSIVLAHTKVLFHQRKQGMAVKLSLGNFSVLDQVTPNTLYPEVFGVDRQRRDKMEAVQMNRARGAEVVPVASPSALSAASASPAPSSLPPFIDLLFDARPLGEDVDSKIVLTVLPSLLVLHHKFLSRLLQFFSTPPSDYKQSPEAVDVMHKWGAAKIASIKQSTTATLSHALHSHSSMKLIAHIAAPTLLVTSTPNILQSDVLVADLGVVSVESTPKTKREIKNIMDNIEINRAIQMKKEEEEEKKKEAGEDHRDNAFQYASFDQPPKPLLSASELRQCYDQLNLRLSDISIFFSQAQSSVGGLGYDPSVKLSILPLLHVGAKLEMSIAPQIGWIPSMRVGGEIGSVEMEISTSNFHKLMRIAESFATVTQPSPKLQNKSIAVAESPAPVQLPRPIATSPHPVFDRPPHSPPYLSPRSPAAASSSSLPLSPTSILLKERLTFDDLTQLFQSEKQARALLDELDLDGNGEVSREEYEEWYAIKKHTLKHNQGMQVEFRVGQIRVKVVEDRRGNATMTNAASSISPPPASASPPVTLTSSSSSPASGHATTLPPPSSSSSSPSPRDICMISLTDLLFTLDSKSFSSRMSLELGSFALMDYLTPYGGEFRSILSSRAPSSTPNKYLPPSSRFLSLTLHLVSHEHPDLGFDDNLVPMDVQVALGNVTLLVDPQAINNVVMFLMKDFLPKKEQEEARVAEEKKEEEDKSKQEQTQLPPVPQSLAPAPTVPTLSMRIRCSLSLFQLLLTQDGHHVSKLAAQSILVNLNMFDAQSGGGLELHAGIGKVALVDLRAERPVHVLIGLEPLAKQQDAPPPPCIEVAFHMFSPALAAQRGSKTLVDAKLRGIKLTPDFYFVGFMLDYLFRMLALPFIAGEKKKEEQLPATEMTAIVVEMVEEKEEKTDEKEEEKSSESSSSLSTPEVPFLKFHASLDDVEVVLHDWKTGDPFHKLMLHIRELEVCNHNLVGVTAEGKRVEYQQYVVGMGSLTMLTGLFPGPEPHSRATTLLHMQQMAVVCSMATELNSTLDVRLGYEKLDVTMAQENYAFIMQMVFSLVDNLQGLTAKPEQKGEEGQAESKAEEKKDETSVAVTPASSSSSTATPSSPPSNWIKVYCRLHDTSLHLLKAKGWNPSDGIMSVLLRDMDLCFHMDTAGSEGMGVEVGFAALEVLDDSMPLDTKSPMMRPEYRRMVTMRDGRTHPEPIEVGHKTAFLASRSPLKRVELDSINTQAHLSDTPTPQGVLVVKWHMAAGTGAMDIDVAINHLAVCLGSMCVMEMTTFFLLPPKPEEATQAQEEKPSPEPATEMYGGEQPSADADSDLMADSVLTGAIIPKVAEQPAGLQLNIRLSMPAAMVQIIASGSTPQARALNMAFALACEFGMGAGSMQASVQLDQLRMVEGVRPACQGGVELVRESERLKQEYILHPTSLHVAFLTAPSVLFPGHSNLTVDVGITPMRLNVGYQQVLLLMEAIKTIMLPAVADKTSEEQVKQTAQTQAHPSASPAPPAVESAPVSKPAPLHFSEQNIHVQIQSLQLNLLNDCYLNSMYLLRVQISDLLGKVHRFGDSGGVYARLDLSADFHNQRVLVWEPILEPWDVVFSMHQSLNTRTPQEYLLLNQPNKTTAMADKHGPELSISNSNMLSSSTSLSALTGPSTASYASSDKSMSMESITTALTPFTDLNLSSSKPFNLTLSVAAVEDLLEFVSLMKDATLRPVPDAHFYSFPPYRVENHTNLDMVVYLTAESVRSASMASVKTSSSSVNPLNIIRTASQKAMSVVRLGDSEGTSSAAAYGSLGIDPATKALLRNLTTELITIPAYSEKDISFPDAIRGSQRAIVVQFQPGFAPFTVGVGKNRSARHALTKVGGQSATTADTATSTVDNAVVVSDVLVKDGVRVISLHSNLAISNQTDGELAVRTSLKTEHIIPRGSRFWLPILPAVDSRHFKVRPYEAVQEGEEVSKVGNIRQINSMTKEGISRSNSFNSLDADMALAPPVPSPHGPPSTSSLTTTSPRIHVPTTLSEAQLLHHWSGDVVCDPKLHNKKRSQETDAVHYRCARQGGKAHMRRTSSMQYQSQPSSPNGSTVKDRASLSGLTFPPSSLDLSKSGASTDNPESVDGSAYNFTVYAALWSKLESKRHDVEQREREASMQSDAGSMPPEAETEAEDHNASFGDLSKKKYCSIYYIRNPLTIDNYLASEAQIRIYNSEKPRDENLQIVEGTRSPLRAGVATTATTGEEVKLDPEEDKLSESAEKEDVKPKLSKKTSMAGRLLKTGTAIGSTIGSSIGSALDLALGSSDEPAVPPKMIEEVTLHRGQSFPSHAASTHLDTFLSIRLPHLSCGWTTPMKLRLDPKGTTTVKLHLVDTGAEGESGSGGGGGGGGALTVLADVSVRQGHVHVMLYTHYWLYDLTKLGLLVINDETNLILPRLAKEQEAQDKITLQLSPHKQLENSLVQDAGSVSPHPAYAGVDDMELDSDSDADSGAEMDRVDLARYAAHARVARMEMDRMDVVTPIMLSSKHRLSKKLQVRIKTGYELIRAGEVEVERTGLLSSNVCHKFLGPTDDPSGFQLPFVPSSGISWSDFSWPFSLEHVGTKESVTIPQYPKDKDGRLRDGRQFEVVVTVNPAPGRFYRTKQVMFVPRFVMVNKLGVPISIRQFAGVPNHKQPQVEQPSSIVTIGALESQTFHWPHSLKDGKAWVCFRRAGPEYADWQWSGYLDLSAPGDFPMLVTNSRNHSSWCLHAEVRMGNHGTSFIVIDQVEHGGMVEQLANQLPYLIHNRSDTQMMRFRQVRDKPQLSSRFQHTASDSSSSSSSSSSSDPHNAFDWFEVPPRGVVPYVWEEPLQCHALQVQFGVRQAHSGKVVEWQKEKIIPLDEPEEEGETTIKMRSDQKAAGSSSSSSSSADSHKLYWYMESSGPTQILVFADRPKKLKKRLLGLRSGKASLEEEPAAAHTALTDDEYKEVPDQSAPPGTGRLPGTRESPEFDGGLSAYDPATEEDRRLHSEAHGPTPSSSSSGPALSVVPATTGRRKSLVPANWNGAGVLHLTVIGASGFKHNRRNMFVVALFNDLRQHTSVCKNTREPKWGQRMTFATSIDSDEFSPKACGCFSTTLVGSEKKKKSMVQDRQVLFINVYEKGRFGDHFLGAATIHLRDIGFEDADRWFDVYKQKGGKRGMEKRGKVHLGVWWQPDEKGAQMMAEEEAGPKTAEVQAAAVAALTDPNASPPVLSLHRLRSTQEELETHRSLYALTQPSAYLECDRSSDRVWSEYRIRILTTALMKDLALAHQLDFLQGRLVAYVTCPLVPRGFSVLLMDHGTHNVVKKWTQDVHICIPHHLAKKGRQAALVRITLFFYKSKSYVQPTREQLLDAHRASNKYLKNKKEAAAVEEAQRAPSQPLDPSASPVPDLPADSVSPPPVFPPPSRSAISGLVSDLYTEPIRLAECSFDLMSVRELGGGSKAGTGADEDEENEEKRAMEEEKMAEEMDKHALEQAEDEEELTSYGQKKSKQSKKKKSKKELLAEEKERQRREWHAKWIPLVSSVPLPKTPLEESKEESTDPSASSSSSSSAPSSSLRVPSLCLNVKRRVIDRDRLQSYRPTTTSIKVSFPLFGISLVDSTPEEVAYFSMSGVGCNINDSQWQTTVSATIHSIQLDNLLRTAAFPILFNPTLLQGDAPVQPFIQIALNRKKNPNKANGGGGGSSVEIIPYFSVLVQKMDVRVEEIDIWRTLNFVNQMLVAVGGKELDRDLDVEGLVKRFSQMLVAPLTGTQKLYFKLLHVQPLAINVSFAAAPARRQGMSGAGHYHINPFSTLLNMLQAGIGNINEAPLRLNGKLIENALGTMDTIVWSLVSHYIQQGIMEAYKIFGSIEALGNPVGLAGNLGSSATDFFMEPAKGLMISPEAFGTGLAKGSGSLLKGTLGGVMSAASSITSSASKAMATASGDEQFIANQAANRNQKQPEHLGQGLAMGAKSFGNSLISGVTGVILDPLAGARSGGVAGFGKGVVKGLAGVVFKPVAGVLDLTSSTLKGIGNTAGYLLDGPAKELTRVRPKRYIDPNTGILTPYNLQEAAQHDLLWQQKQKKEKNKEEEHKEQAAKIK